MSNAGYGGCPRVTHAPHFFVRGLASKRLLSEIAPQKHAGDQLLAQIARAPSEPSPLLTNILSGSGWAWWFLHADIIAKAKHKHNCLNMYFKQTVQLQIWSHIISTTPKIACSFGLAGSIMKNHNRERLFKCEPRPITNLND